MMKMPLALLASGGSFRGAPPIGHRSSSWAGFKGLAVVLLSTLLLLCGCSELDLGDVPFRCGEDDGGERTRCPTGYECVDGYCLLPGALPPDPNGPVEGRPVADAGPDQFVQVGEVVELSGDGTDPEDRPLSFEWEQTEGLPVALSDVTVPSPTFLAPDEPGTLAFSLVVRAGGISSEPDSVTVVVIGDDEHPICGPIGEGCRYASFSGVTGDLESGDVFREDFELRATRSQGVGVAAVEDGCFFVSSMLANESVAELSQTFRVAPEDDGRFLETIDLGPLTWFPPEHPGPDGSSLFLTIMTEEGPVTASQPTSAIGGSSVRFDFSQRRLRLVGGDLHEMRLSTNVPIGTETRIAWHSVRYDDSDCVDEEGTMRRNEDPGTSLRYCSSDGVCGAPLDNTDAVFKVRASPRALVTLEELEDGPLSASTVEAAVEGGILFDLRVGGGDLEPALAGVELDELVASGAFGDRLELTMNFVDRPASLECLKRCLAATLPSVEIVSAPPEVTSSDSAVVEVVCSEDECDLECAKDDDPYAPCDSVHEMDELLDGLHRLKVRASRPGEGRYGPPAVHVWTVDTVPPETTFVSTPEDPTDVGEATFEFSCDKDDCLFECSLDDDEPADCVSPWLVTDLAPGFHTFRVRAIDAAGNVGQFAEFSWTVES